MIDLENEYMGPAMMRGYLASIDGWHRDSAAYREASGARAELEVPYGDKPRQRVDIFAPERGAGGPVALFIHGGYWQAMEKSSYSHLARGANAHGITVVLAGYTLCPAATVAAIVDEIRAAVAFVRRRFDKPVTVFGHSAGGHLTGCMLATDWRSVDPSFDEKTVPNGLPISGLFDLEPLLATSVNKLVRLDAAEARRLSPLFWRAPVGKTMIAYVGGDESSELRCQTHTLVERWGALGVKATGVESPGEGHFQVIAPLADPESAITRDLVKLARAAR